MIRNAFLTSASLLAAVALGGCATTQETTMTMPASTVRTAAAAPLIPREALFGNPTRSAGRLSPDGEWLSWLAPSGGVMNVWLAPASDPSAAKAMTASTDRPIRQYFWSPDSQHLLYIQDKDGDENFLLYGIDIASGAETTLTPFEKTRVMLVGSSTTLKDKLLIGLNNRDPRYHDVYRLDLPTGKMTEVMRNDGYAAFLADDTLTLRMAIKANAASGRDYLEMQDGKVADEPVASTGLEDSLTTSPAGYTTDGKTLYWIDSRGRNTAALIAVDIKTGKPTVLAENSKADIGGALSNPVTGRIEAYSVQYLKTDWTALDPTVKASLDCLDSRLEGEFSVTSRTDDDTRWIVANDPLTSPAKTWLYDRTANTLTEFYTARPDLVGAPLQPMHPLEIRARDGKTLVSYLTLPPGSDRNADGVPDAPVPMVLLVHGGPWGRDSYGFNAYHQWLANRGYAVMSVNFRGSTGLGKDFISAGDLQWGRAMQTDLDDAMDWAIAQGVAQADKVAIMGGSYGGYATLAGMAFTPERYACGVDIVGPSNLETLLKTIPPYWAPIVEQFHRRMGNPATPEGLAMLKERSPLYSAGQIVRPLLIGQGANDPRVNQAESDQIVAAMKAKGIPVTYVLFPDEGHGFAKPANNIAFNAVAENFLATCLGGRAEPLGETLGKSTAKIVQGAEFVRGLGATGQ
jgi:dipeptidyl aminopeptidase/acylaminoacyl peptidase